MLKLSNWSKLSRIRYDTLFLLIFKDEDDRDSHRENYLPTMEIKCYKIITGGKNSLGRPIKVDLKV